MLRTDCKKLESNIGFDSAEMLQDFFGERVVEFVKGGMGKVFLYGGMMVGVMAKDGSNATRTYKILSGLGYGTFGVACLMMIGSYIAEICKNKHRSDGDGIKYARAEMMFVKLFKIFAVIAIGFLLAAGISVAASM